MRPLLFVDPERCPGCAPCEARRTCRTRAIVQPERGDRPLIQTSRCLGCFACILTCPFEAIRRDTIAPDPSFPAK